ncbi:MAG: hypothetical protein LBT39_05755, partial [Treponema sp.]|nr:hypothetical protein [Treponema sp.]
LIETAQKESGLVEITKDGGLPFIYQPFLFQGNEKPLTLRAEADPNGPPIQEQNGVHQINSEILDPDQESTRRLDQKFLNLVESILNKEE